MDSLNGACFYTPSDGLVSHLSPVNRYDYMEVYLNGVLPNRIHRGDSIILLSVVNNTAYWVDGNSYNTQELVEHDYDIGLEIRGYQCGCKSTSLEVIPAQRYRQGGAVRTLFAPERAGDPKVDLVVIPVGCRQEAGVYPTVRVAYVLRGEGLCVLDREDKSIEIREGSVVILDPMVLHHFYSPEEEMTIVFIHINSEGE